MFMGGDDLQGWVRGATPGASVCLGVASSVPAATQPALRALTDAGLIDIARKRVGDGRYSFEVQRRSRRYVAPTPVQKAPTRPRGGMHARRAGTVERRVLKLLLTAAAKGLPCPTNAAIARAVGLSDGIAASYRLRRLVARGLIRVAVPEDPRLHRIVTIVASGESTKGGAR
ncbi:MAG: winged helix-turn-helix domain-containing protein [Sphingopyxis terrae]|nr:winged helix-turn-helix domain-containing protein [Sphingopyxis terrae]